MSLGDFRDVTVFVENRNFHFEKNVLDYFPEQIPLGLKLCLIISKPLFQSIPDRDNLQLLHILQVHELQEQLMELRHISGTSHKTQEHVMDIYES